MKTVIQKPVMDSQCRIQLKQSEKSALTSKYLYKAECHQHIDGRKPCYFGLTDQDL